MFADIFVHRVDAFEKLRCNYRLQLRRREGASEGRGGGDLIVRTVKIISTIPIFTNLEAISVKLYSTTI